MERLRPSSASRALNAGFKTKRMFVRNESRLMKQLRRPQLVVPGGGEGCIFSLWWLNEHFASRTGSTAVARGSDDW